MFFVEKTRKNRTYNCAEIIFGYVWRQKNDPNKSSRLVEGDGFEPSKSVTADLQSAPFSHSGILPYNKKNLTQFWSWLTESNHQPADYKSAALPVELSQQNGALGRS